MALRSALDDILMSGSTTSDVAMEPLVNVPEPGELPAETTQRVVQNRIVKARQLARNGTPSYTDKFNNTQAVVDESGQPMTGYKESTGTALDSMGSPRKLTYATPTQQPKLTDPYEMAETVTTQSTGDQFKVVPGLPRKYIGQDAQIVEQRRIEKEQRQLSKVSGILGRKLSLDERDYHQDERDFAKKQKTLQKEFQIPAGMGLEDARNHVNSQFDAQLASPEASKTGWFDSDLTPDAIAYRSQVEQGRAAALAKLDDFTEHAKRLESKASIIAPTQEQKNEIEAQRLENTLKELEAGGYDTSSLRAQLAPQQEPVEQPERGLLKEGNIDLSSRPVVKNSDGTISTVRSIGVEVDGREVLIPTVSDDGRVMSNEEAVKTFKQTGRHLGVFDTPENASAYAQKLHQEQDAQYGEKAAPTEQAPEQTIEASPALYPVTDYEALHPSVQKFLKDNPTVAGMAMGGGENGTDANEPRTIIVNPYNQYMSDPVKREGLIKIESVRHLMGESGYKANFDVTPKQKEWQKTLGAYANNDEAFKNSIVSRLVAHDYVPDATSKQIAEAEKFERELNKRSQPAQPVVEAAKPALENEDDSSDLWRGAKISIGQLPGLLKGTIALLGGTVENIVGKGGLATKVKEWGIKGYMDSQKETQAISKDTDDINVAWKKAKDGDIGALADWVQYGIGYTVGQAGETIGIALASGLAASAATGPAAPVAGTVAAAGAIVGKQAAKNLIRNAVESLIAKKAVKMATKEAEKAALKTGVAISSKEIAERAASAEVRKAAAARIAQTTAIAANSLMMEAGSIYPEAIQQAHKEGRELDGGDLARVWGTSLLATGTETLTDRLGLDVVLGKLKVGSGGRLAKGVATGTVLAGVEGAQELVQTFLERVGAGQNLTDEEAQGDYINSTALGVLGGGIVGGAGAALNGGKEPTPPDEGAAPTAPNGPTAGAPPAPPNGSMSADEMRAAAQRRLATIENDIAGENNKDVQQIPVPDGKGGTKMVDNPDYGIIDKRKLANLQAERDALAKQLEADDVAGIAASYGFGIAEKVNPAPPAPTGTPPPPAPANKQPAPAPAPTPTPITNPLHEAGADKNTTAINVTTKTGDAGNSRSGSIGFSSEAEAAKYIAEERAKNPNAVITASGVDQYGVNKAEVEQAVARLNVAPSAPAPIIDPAELQRQMQQGQAAGLTGEAKAEPAPAAPALSAIESALVAFGEGALRATADRIAAGRETTLTKPESIAQVKASPVHTYKENADGSVTITGVLHPTTKQWVRAESKNDNAAILARVSEAEAKAQGLGDILNGESVEVGAKIDGLLTARADSMLGGRRVLVFDNHAAAEAFSRKMAGTPGLTHGVNFVGDLAMVNVRDVAGGTAATDAALKVTSEVAPVRSGEFPKPGYTAAPAAPAAQPAAPAAPAPKQAVTASTKLRSKITPGASVEVTLRKGAKKFHLATVLSVEGDQVQVKFKKGDSFNGGETQYVHISNVAPLKSARTRMLNEEQFDGMTPEKKRATKIAAKEFDKLVLEYPGLGFYDPSAEAMEGIGATYAQKAARDNAYVDAMKALGADPIMIHPKDSITKAELLPKLKELVETHKAEIERQYEQQYAHDKAVSEMEPEQLGEEFLLDPEDVWPSLDTQQQVNDYINVHHAAEIGATAKLTPANIGEVAREEKADEKGNVNAGEIASAEKPAEDLKLDAPESVKEQAARLKREEEDRIERERVKDERAKQYKRLSGDDGDVRQGDLLESQNLFSPAVPKPYAKQEPAKDEARTLDNEGRPLDGKPIMPGDVFKTSSGRTTTPYPKYSTKRPTARDDTAANQWLLDNAIAEAKARGDEFNETIFSGEKAKGMPPASVASMQEYLFGEQPKVIPPITRPLAPKQFAPAAKVEPAKSIMGERVIAKDWTDLSAEELPPLDRELTGYGAWRRAVAASALPNGTKFQREALALEISNAVSSETAKTDANGKPKYDAWQTHIIAQRIAGQILTGGGKEILRAAKERSLGDEYAQWDGGMEWLDEGKEAPISVEAFDKGSSRPLPDGYVKRGDFYVREVVKPAEPAKAEVKQEGKQPWEMTQREWNNQLADQYESAVTGNESVNASRKRIAGYLRSGKLKAPPTGGDPNSPYKAHRGLVSQALSEGKPVPPEVLADYPDLAKAESKPTTYINGDKVEFTGETRDIAGGKFYVFKFLEGTRAGKEGVTQRGPDGKSPDDGRAQAEFRQQQEDARKIAAAQKASKDATLESVAAEYGWTVKNGELFNRSGSKVHDIEIKKGRVRLSSNGTLRGTFPESDPAGLGRYLEKTYYAKKEAKAPVAEGMKTQADTAFADKTHEELLELAAPYTEFGPNYNRNIAVSYDQLKQAVANKTKFAQLNADELAVRLEKWGKPPEQKDELPAAQRYQIKGAGPQIYSIVERIEQTSTESENNEQPIRVKNEKTGKVEVVMETDLVPVGEGSGKKARTKTDAFKEAQALGIDPRGMDKATIEDQIRRKKNPPTLKSNEPTNTTEGDTDAVSETSSAEKGGVENQVSSENDGVDERGADKSDTEAEIASLAEEHQSEETTDVLPGGLEVVPSTNKIRHNKKRLSDLAVVIENQGGNAKKWMRAAFDEEGTHLLQLVATKAISMTTGKDFETAHREFYAMIPKPIAAELSNVYTASDSPVNLAAELFRIIDQIRRTGSFTEEHSNATPEECAKLRKLLAAWTAPEAWERQQQRIAEARAGSEMIREAQKNDKPTAEVPKDQPKGEKPVRGPPVGVQYSNARITPPGLITLFANNPIRAFHGTPHKVDKFSLDKVGTGEGAQVYGWGLYFAENKAVADGYRSQLQPAEATRLESLKISIATMERSVISAQGDLKVRWQSKLDELRAKLPDAQSAAEKVTPGNTYTVSLDVEPDELLDWDKPLSEQSEKAKGAVLSDSAFVAYVERIMEKPMTDLTGGELQKMRLGFETDKGSSNPSSEASGWFSSLGIPGIRYLDQGSRPVKKRTWQPDTQTWREELREDATYNYVIFDESKINITHKNGEDATKEQMATVLRANDPTARVDKSVNQVNEKTDELTGAKTLIYAKTVSADSAGAIAESNARKLQRFTETNRGFETSDPAIYADWNTSGSASRFWSSRLGASVLSRNAEGRLYSLANSAAGSEGIALWGDSENVVYKLYMATNHAVTPMAGMRNVIVLDQNQRTGEPVVSLRKAWGDLGSIIEKAMVLSHIGMPTEIVGFKESDSLLVTKQPFAGARTQPGAHMGFWDAMENMGVVRVPITLDFYTGGEDTFLAQIGGKYYIFNDATEDRNMRSNTLGESRPVDIITGEITPEILQASPTLREAAERTRPLDGRMLFANDPTAKTRITPQQDKDYLAAVEKGDTETAQKMVDEAAKKAGYDVGPVFHRGEKWTVANFDIIDKGRQLGLHVGTEAQIKNISKRDGSREDKRVFLSAKNPLRLEDFGVWTFETLYPQMKRAGVEFTRQEIEDAKAKEQSGLPADLSQVSKKLREKIESAGYDSVIYLNMTEGVDHVSMERDYRLPKSGRIRKHYTEAIGRDYGAKDSYIIFHPNQIKSADPITRDADGNVIPLSERFNSNSNSILFANDPTRREADPFYSQLTRTVQGLPQETMTVAQARAAIEKGAKKDEIAMSGILTDVLSPLYIDAGRDLYDPEVQSQLRGPQNKVTKAELTSYAMERQATVQDVVLGTGEGQKLTKPEERELADLIYTTPNQLSPKMADRKEELRARKKAAESNQTHFSQYQLPGADEGSYREMFVTWPQTKRKPDVAAREFYTTFVRVGGAPHWEGLTDLEKQHYISITPNEAKNEPGWRDGHEKYSDIANPIVRMRVNTRTLPLESIRESHPDLYAKLRDEGRTTVKMGFGEEFQGPSKENSAKMPRELDKRKYEIGMKRFLRWAVDEECDLVGWTTGEQQADRYDLSKSVSSIKWNTYGKDMVAVWATRRDTGGTAIEDTYPIAKLPDVIGKELAQQVQADIEKGLTAGEFEGEGLKVGGEGLKRLYDVTLPSIANELAKKFGVRTGTAAMRVPDGSSQPWRVMWESEPGQWTEAFLGTKAEMEERAKAGGSRYRVEPNTDKAISINSLAIPDALKQQQRAGNTLFANDPTRRVTQVFGVRGVGNEADVRSEKEAVENVREKFFDSRDTVSAERTEKAWSVVTEWMQKKGEFGERVKRLGGSELAWGALIKELRAYANKANDAALIRTLVHEHNLFAMPLDPDTSNSSAAGAILRGLAGGGPLMDGQTIVNTDKTGAAGVGIEGGADTIKKLRDILNRLNLTPEELQDLAGTLGSKSTFPKQINTDTPGVGMGVILQEILRLAYAQGKTRIKIEPFKDDPKDRIDKSHPLYGLRAELEDKGGTALNDSFWRLIVGSEKEKGHVATMNDAMQGELGRILREKMIQLGMIKESDIAKLTDAAKLAMILGEGELRDGKVSRADELVREEIEKRYDLAVLKAGEDVDAAEAVEIQYQQLRDAWEESTKSLLNDPASARLFRKMVRSELSNRDHDWQAHFKDGKNTNDLRAEIVKSLSKQTQDAATNTLDLADVEKKFGKAFDEIHAAKLASWNLREAERIARQQAKKSAPEKTAQEILDKIQSEQTEWKKPDAKINEVREIVRKYLSDEVSLNEDAPKLFREPMAAELVKAGVNPNKATQLAEEVWMKKRTAQSADIQKEMDRLANVNDEGRARGNIVGLINEIMAAPRERQLDPAWRKRVAIDYFLKNGLTLEYAEAAQRIFDPEFSKVFEAAQNRAAAEVLKGKPEATLRKVQDALRSQVANPDIDWESKLAMANGWKGLSKADYEAMLKLDSIIESESTNQHQRAKAISELLGIAQKAMRPEGKMQVIADGFRASALSGIPTFTVNAIGPIVGLMRNLVVDAVSNPADAKLAWRAFTDGLAAFFPEGRWAAKNDVYQYHQAEHLGGDSKIRMDGLKNMMEAALKTLRDPSASVVQKTKALAKFIYGAQSFVFRGLSSLDQAAQAAIEKSSLVMFASDTMRKAGYSREDVTNILNSIRELKQTAYEDAIAGGATPLDAQVHAQDAAVEAYVSVMSELKGVGPEKAAEVLKAAQLDAQSIVGLRAKGVKENEEGFTSRLFMNHFMEYTAKLGQSENPLARIGGVMAFGFVNVPYRALRYFAGFSPYGLLRWAVYQARTKAGKENWWKQTYGTRQQARKRLKEALVGTAIMIAAGVLARNTTDDDDKDGFFVTGKGPESTDKGVRDAWLKKWKPYSIHFKLGNSIVNIPLGRTGEAILAPFALAGALDDYALKTKQGRGKKDWTTPGKSGEILGSYFYSYMQRGVFSSFSRLGEVAGARQGNPLEKAAKTAGYSVSPIIPFNGTMMSLTRMLTNTPDKTSLSAAIFSNTPVALLAGYPALNTFGDPIGDQTARGKVLREGSPVSIGGGNNEAAYQVVLKSGQAPPTPNRSQVERTIGLLTDEEWYRYSRARGQRLKALVTQQAATLNGMEPVKLNDRLGDLAKTANETGRTAINRASVAKPAGNNLAIPRKTINAAPVAPRPAKRKAMAWDGTF